MTQHEQAILDAARRWAAEVAQIKNGTTIDPYAMLCAQADSLDALQAEDVQQMRDALASC